MTDPATPPPTPAPPPAGDVPGAVARYRAEYRATEIPANYRGTAHALFTFGVVPVLLLACL